MRYVLLVFALALAGGATGCSARGSASSAATPAPPQPGEVVEARASAEAAPVVATTFDEARAAGQAELSFFYVPARGFAYEDERGELTGVTVELLRDFAAYVATTHGLDLRVTWVEEPEWAAFYDHVRASRGGAFGIGNVTITEARRDELDFSPPYLHNIAVLVTHDAVPGLLSLDAVGGMLEGFTALVFPGTLHEARIEALRDRYLPDLETEAVTSNDELISRLTDGGDHFGYVDVYNFWRAREQGKPLRRHAVADDASESFGVISPHGTDWTPILRAFFEADGGYASSERFEDHLRRHLGDELAALLAAPSP
jgi:ABC-type amino acid transport substrate-binding protein